jgi:AAA15 family ATPase/GTPase
MLSKFSVKNFKGFNDWITLDFSKVNNYEFNTSCIQNGIVKDSIIYGYNGVGKSNLGLAIMDIVIHFTDKNRQIDMYQNFTNANNKNKIAEFSYHFKFDDANLVYKYGKLNCEDIIYEQLSINNVEAVSYDRRENNSLRITLPGTENLNKEINQIKISVLKYIKSNTVLPETDEAILFNKLILFVDNMLLFWQLDNRGYQGYETGSTSMLNDIVTHGHFDNFKQFLETAGLDSNIMYHKEADDNYSFLYQFESGSVDFWKACSTGTKSLVLFYFWLQRIKYEDTKPSFVYIDEFDAFYHQRLSEFVVKELINTTCQVVLTTHNTSIMTNDILRPDCYFLMYKDRIKSLASLTDKELRYGHNIEKMYRAGAFDE